MKETSFHPVPVSGDVLIADPHLRDPNFSQSLVFIQENDEEGAFGLILNRPVGKTVGDLIDDPDVPDVLKDLPLFFGGPVRTDQFLLALFVRNAGGYSVRCVLNPDGDEILEAVSKGLGQLRAFVGYAGWGTGQLGDEIVRGDWAVAEGDVIMVGNDPPPGLWELYQSRDRRWLHLRDRLPEKWGVN